MVGGVQLSCLRRLSHAGDNAQARASDQAVATPKARIGVNAPHRGLLSHLAEADCAADRPPYSDLIQFLAQQPAGRTLSLSFF